MRALWGVFVALVVGCPSPERALSVVARPSQIDNHGQPSTIAISAAVGEAAGRGDVHVTSSAGLLVSETLALDAQGAAETGFSCDVAADSHCTGQVTVTAEWASGGVTTTGQARVRLTDSAAGGGGGGGAGSGGGASGAGGGVPFTPDPGEAYLYGTLREGAAYLDAVAVPTDPRHPWVGFPQDTWAGSQQLTSAGQLLYVLTPATGGDRLYLFRPDAFQRDGGPGPSPTVYPATPLLNDIELTPTCPTGFFTGYWAWPDQPGFAYSCGVGPDYFFEDGGAMPGLSGETLLALGVNGTALVGWPTPTAVVDATGQHFAIADAGLFAPLRFKPSARGGHAAVRARPDGFWVPSDASGTCVLLLIKLDASIEQAGELADQVPNLPQMPGPAEPSFCFGVLDRRGALHMIQRFGFDDYIVRRPLKPETSVIELDEPDSGLSNLFVYPPVLWTRIHISSMFTGP